MQHVVTDDNDAAAEIDAIGRLFADKYYGALASVGGVGRFFGGRSKYLYLRRRRPDVLIRGADAIGRFVARMNYGECAVRVDTVDAIRVADRYAVLAVCRLTRPRQPARRFVQSTIVEHAPRRGDGGDEFSIVGTVFRFDDDDDAVTDEPSPDDWTVPPPEQISSPSESAAVEAVAADRDDDDDDAAETHNRPAKTRRKRPTKVVPPPAEGPAAKSRTETAGKGRERSKEAAVKGRGGKDADRVGSPRRRQKPAAAAKKPSRVAAELGPSLYVGGLSKRYEADELRAVFGRFGAITAVGPCTAVSKKKNRPACAYYAIVQFEDPATVDAVSRLGTVSLENAGGGRAVVQKSTRGPAAAAAAKPR